MAHGKLRSFDFVRIKPAVLRIGQIVQRNVMNAALFGLLFLAEIILLRVALNLSRSSSTNDESNFLPSALPVNPQAVKESHVFVASPTLFERSLAGRFLSHWVGMLVVVVGRVV